VSGTARAGSWRRHGVRRLLLGPVGRTVLTVAVVVAVFAGALPRIADYSQAWSLVRGLTAAEVALLSVVAVVNLLSYAWLWVAAVPGLRWTRAVMAEEASTAVSNTVPAGFAFGVGTTAAMFSSFGVPAGDIARAVTLTGVWNNLVKLGTPVLALAGLALTGDDTRALTVAAVLGTAALLLVAGALAAVLAGHDLARAVGAGAQRTAAPLWRALRRPAPHGWPESVQRFRADSITLVRARWPHLTAAAVGSHAALFVLLLTTLRLLDGAGTGVSWWQVLAVFALTRVITLVPITPGALGVAELSYVAGLTAVGVPAAVAAGAVLVFRFLTWFLPIPVGVGCWVLWRRTSGRTAPGQDALTAAGR
jgi:putative heme transporter